MGGVECYAFSQVQKVQLSSCVCVCVMDLLALKFSTFSGMSRDRACGGVRIV